jgi:hypothetical protein
VVGAADGGEDFGAVDGGTDRGAVEGGTDRGAVVDDAGGTATGFPLGPFELRNPGNAKDAPPRARVTTMNPAKKSKVRERRERGATLEKYALCRRYGGDPAIQLPAGRPTGR